MEINHRLVAVAVTAILSVVVILTTDPWHHK